LNIDQAVAFAILMESEGGILAKDSAYILEKLEACSMVPEPAVLLDRQNREKYRRWQEAWSKTKP
jgi:hypothetical protein